MNDLLKSKTFWTGVIGVLTAAGSAATGEMDTSQAVNLGVTSLLAIFIRDGIRKSGK